MRKRLFIASFILVGLILVGLALVNPTQAQDGDPHYPPEVLRGAVLYAEFCAACHGATGEAIATGPAFRAINTYDPSFAEGRIAEGYDSSPDDDIVMIGYRSDYNGPLSNAQINDILAYMATWSNEELQTPPLPEPNLAPGDTEVIGIGDPAHGAVIYAKFCLGCHGLNAQGREDLENFPAFEINENTKRIVERGEGHGAIAAFGTSFGGPLSTDDLNDLDAYLRSIEAVAEEDEGPEGVSILLIILGLGAVGIVGATYMVNQRNKKTA